MGLAVLDLGSQALALQGPSSPPHASTPPVCSARMRWPESAGRPRAWGREGQRPSLPPPGTPPRPAARERRRAGSGGRLRHPAAGKVTAAASPRMPAKSAVVAELAEILPALHMSGGRRLRWTAGRRVCPVSGRCPRSDSERGGSSRTCRVGRGLLGSTSGQPAPRPSRLMKPCPAPAPRGPAGIRRTGCDGHQSRRGAPTSVCTPHGSTELAWGTRPPPEAHQETLQIQELSPLWAPPAACLASLEGQSPRTPSSSPGHRRGLRSSRPGPLLQALAPGTPCGPSLHP